MNIKISIGEALRLLGNYEWVGNPIKHAFYKISGGACN